MFTKRTGIGIGVGSAIIAIGLFALVTSFGVQTINVDETFRQGEDTSYQIRAQQGEEQFMRVSADKFSVKIAVPGQDVQQGNFTSEATFEWSQQEDGRTRVEVRNHGSSEMAVTGVFKVATDPILFAYHIVVITAGVIIIGFSMGFSIRKPRGF